MSYPIEIRLASKNGYFTPAESNNYYKTRYARTGFTVHWWNSPQNVRDSDHDNIVNYMLGNASRGVAPTVNYVLSNTKITLVVNPDNVAWASGNGNPTTVSCEFSPHLNAEGYKKAGWLINELEGRYGRTLALYPHNHWMTTQCPGTLDIKRMRAEANKWKSGGYAPKPVPAPVPAPKPVPQPVSAVSGWTLWKEGTVEYVCNKQPTHLWNFDSTTWNMNSVKQFNKGDRITIAGSATNTKLKTTYYVTGYSFSKKTPTGFNPADLDVYVAPRPQPEPPKEEEQKPPVPKPEPVPSTPNDPETDSQKISKILEIVQTIYNYFMARWGTFRDFVTKSKEK